MNQATSPQLLFHAFLPLPLLPGKVIYNYKKLWCLFSVAPMIVLLYGFTMQLLPYWVYVIVGGFSIILSAVGFIKIRRIFKQDNSSATTAKSG